MPTRSLTAVAATAIALPLAAAAPAAGAVASAAPDAPAPAASATTAGSATVSADTARGLGQRVSTGRRTTSLLSAGRPSLTIPGVTTSWNWAGIVQRQKTSSVSATFRVPKLTSKFAGYACTWVGIDGVRNGYLTQVGVAEDMVKGHAYYFAWWEVITPTKELPQQPIRLAVRPGDTVQVSVKISRGVSTMYVRNATLKSSVTKKYAYKGPGASAEWIQEDARLGSKVSPAPSWGSVTFSKATRNGVNPRMLASQRFEIVDKTGTRETRTSAPVGGNSVTVKLLSGGHWSAL